MLRENVEAELTPKYIFVIIFVYKHKKAGNKMASSIVHLAITNELIKTHEFNNISRLKLGVVLPDAGETNLGHLKIKIPETNGSTYDFEKFRCKFSDEYVAEAIALCNKELLPLLFFPEIKKTLKLS